MLGGVQSSTCRRHLLNRHRARCREFNTNCVKIVVWVCMVDTHISTNDDPAYIHCRQCLRTSEGSDSRQNHPTAVCIVESITLDSCVKQHEVPTQVTDVLTGRQGTGGRPNEWDPTGLRTIVRVIDYHTIIWRSKGHILATEQAGQ